MKRKIFKKVTAMVVAAGMAIALAACGGGKQETGSTSGLETKKLSLGAARDTQLAPIIMCAIEKGYFKEQGLDVELTLFASGGDLTAAVASGDIQLGSAGDTPTTALLTSDYGKFEFIARTTNLGGALALVTSEDIQTPQDLEGRTIGYAAGNTSEALWQALVATTGIDESKVNLVALGAADMLSAYEAGDIEGFVIWEPTVTNGVKLGAHRLLTGSKSYFNGVEEDFDCLNSYALLSGNKEWIEKNPNTVVAVLTAMNDACEWLNGNMGEGAEIVSKWLELDYEDCLGMMQRNEYGLSVDDRTMDDLKASAEFLYGGEKIPFVPEFREVYDGSYLEKVDASLNGVTK